MPEVDDDAATHDVPLAEIEAAATDWPVSCIGRRPLVHDGRALDRAVATGARLGG